MKTTWKTAPISPTCEVQREGVPLIIDNGAIRRGCLCDDPTSYAYPAHGGGWMALCFRHGQKHLPHVQTIEELIRGGETFA